MIYGNNIILYLWICDVQIHESIYIYFLYIVKLFSEYIKVANHNDMLYNRMNISVRYMNVRNFNLDIK